jgi:hypothetical protein
MIPYINQHVTISTVADRYKVVNFERNDTIIIENLTTGELSRLVLTNGEWQVQYYPIVHIINFIGTNLINDTIFETGVNNLYDQVGNLLQEIVPQNTADIPRISVTPTTEYIHRNKNYQVHILSPGSILTYHSGGYGDCSIKSYVVISVTLKKTNPHKGIPQNAVISPVIRANNHIVVYDPTTRYNISLIFYHKGTYNIEGWNFDKRSSGHFVHDRLEKYNPGICK